MSHIVFVKSTRVSFGLGVTRNSISMCREVVRTERTCRTRLCRLLKALQRKSWFCFHSVFFAFMASQPVAWTSLCHAFVLAVFAVVVWGWIFVNRSLHELDVGVRNAGVCPLLEDPTVIPQEWVEFPSVFEPPGKYITLILPAFNEKTRIRVTLDDMLSYLQERAQKDASFTFEIIIVDDGSTDNTVKIANEYVSKYGVEVIRVLKLGTNQGKGAAVRKGMLCSRGQLLLMLDSDGATKFSDLEKLEYQMPRSMIEQMASVVDTPMAVWGSRAHLENQALATRKWYRNLLMKGFHLFVRMVAGGGIRDTQCGFKMFTRAAAQKLFQNMRLTRWCFDVELLYLCNRLHFPVHEVAVTWTEIPGSKINLLSIAHMLLELLFVHLGYGLHIWEVHTSLVQA